MDRVSTFSLNVCKCFPADCSPLEILEIFLFLAFPCAVKGSTAKIHLVGEDLAKAVKGTGLKGKLLFFSFCLEALKLHFCLSNILLASEHVQLKSKHSTVLSIKKKTGPDKNAAIHGGGGGGGFLLTCENLGRMFDNSFPAFACFLFF